MGEWSAIESEVLTVLTQMEGASGPLLATARAVAAQDRKKLAAALVRERMPAAYVAVCGRQTSKQGSANGRGEAATTGAPLLSILLGSRSDRSADDLRKGGTGVVGVFELAEVAAGALQNRGICGPRRLQLLHETCLGSEDNVCLWEQQYVVPQVAVLPAPTFGGEFLAGAGSYVEVEIGAARRSSTAFAFPGIDGVFEQFLGMRERPIFWRGQLRGDGDAALDALEEAIEEELRKGTAQTMADEYGRSYASCVMQSFQRRGARRREEVTGKTIQDFEIEFQQLTS